MESIQKSGNFWEFSKACFIFFQSPPPTRFLSAHPAAAAAATREQPSHSHKNRCSATAGRAAVSPSADAQDGPADGGQRHTPAAAAPPANGTNLILNIKLKI